MRNVCLLNWNLYVPIFTNIIKIDEKHFYDNDKLIIFCLLLRGRGLLLFPFYKRTT